MLRSLIIGFACFAALPVHAMVGGAPLARPEIARHVILIVGSRGNSCTGVVVATDLVLTAAHCVLPGAEYKWVDFATDGAPILQDVVAIERHPDFSLASFRNSRATADVALLKLASKLPPKFAPAALEKLAAPKAGDRVVVAGYGVAIRGDGKSGGKVRSALLVITGRPGTLQVRLMDPAAANRRAGLGACTGDSGAPAFAINGKPVVLGLVSWSTAANNEAGCGGLTGVTPLERYRSWISDTAVRLRSRIPNM
ncbi:MAG TPA: trypsin-like serine protease [Xanthobacteraceae bacterium]|nr:trypsin-like serine protease [Xanthobacteraceae bacterium]